MTMTPVMTTDVPQCVGFRSCWFADVTLSLSSRWTGLWRRRMKGSFLHWKPWSAIVNAKKDLKLIPVLYLFFFSLSKLSMLVTVLFCVDDMPTIITLLLEGVLGCVCVHRWGTRRAKHTKTFSAHTHFFHLSSMQAHRVASHRVSHSFTIMNKSHLYCRSLLASTTASSKVTQCTASTQTNNVDDTLHKHTLGYICPLLLFFFFKNTFLNTTFALREKVPLHNQSRIFSGLWRIISL